LNNKKGIVLLVVILAILMTVLLANIALTIISSQARLTHHQVGRIQAYYASMAGVNYTLEMLRTGRAGWTTANCTAASPCTVTDTEFPGSIVNKRVNIVLLASAAGLAGCDRNLLGDVTCIQATTDYTYTP